MYCDRKPINRKKKKEKSSSTKERQHGVGWMQVPQDSASLVTKSVVLSCVLNECKPTTEGLWNVKREHVWLQLQCRPLAVRWSVIVELPCGCDGRALWTSRGNAVLRHFTVKWFNGPTSSVLKTKNSAGLQMCVSEHATPHAYTRTAV